VVAQERRGGSGFSVDSIEEGSDLQLAGDRAATLEIALTAGGRDFRSEEVIAVHDDAVFRVTLTAARDRFAKDQRQFHDALASWRWTS
jgi:hypothetical protein